MDETQTADVPSAPPPSTEGLQPGRTVGRYVLSGLIGRGGMGVVYAAIDPELRRTVALKIVSSVHSHGERARRLVREAQALASLNHPNVVTVYDVGTSDEGRVFIAMELVEGQTLTEWRRTSPSPREVRAVLANAGRGLLAAHRGELVHRDIKPDNIMLADDGRVLVLDFGLAREAESRREEAEPFVADDAAVESNGNLIDATVGIVGTPAYMAPEQARSGEVSALSDQFSYCTVAWEALYGERPFGTGPAHTLERRVGEGTPKPSGGQGVSGRLRRALIRGLSLEAERRWSSLEPLIAELERRPVGPRVALGAVVAIGLGTAVVLGSTPDERCSDPARHVAQAWSDAQRSTVVESLGGVDVVGAETSTRVVEALDRHADQLRGAWNEACAATDEGHGPAYAAMERCLLLSRGATSTVVEALAKSPEVVAARAVDAIGMLPDPSRCVSASSTLPAAPEPAIAAQVDEAARQLVAATALSNLGRSAEALEQVRSTQVTVDELGHPPQVAESRMVESAILVDLGDPSSTDALKRTYGLAVEAQADATAYEAATGLVVRLGTYEGRHDAADAWATVARAHLERSGLGLAGELRLEQALANSDFRAGEIGRAIERFEAVLAKTEGNEAVERERLEIIGNLAAAHSRVNHLEEAAEHFTGALEAMEVRYGPNHLWVGKLLGNMGFNLFALGRFEDAEATLERSIAIIEAIRGADDPLMLAPRSNLGRLRLSTGDIEGARRALVGTTEMAEARYGADNMVTSTAGLRMGWMHERAGEWEQAEHELSRSVRRCDAAAGTNLARCGRVRSALGHLLLTRDRVPEALALLERAVVLMADDESADHFERAQARLYLGHALVVGGSDPTRGLALFDEAATVFEQDTPWHRHVRDEIVEFRRTHPRTGS